MTTTATNLLDTPYELSDAQKTQFREDGFIKLKDVLDAETLAEYGEEITKLTLAHQSDVPMDKRDTYSKAFIQVGNLWEQSDKAKQFSFSKRIARLAAELMDTDGVRMYHDQSLYKEPAGGFTPWHVDQQYWPFARGKTVTAWIPLQAVPMDMGPLCFGKGSHVKNLGRDLEISDESEKQIRQMVKDNGVVEVFEPYDAGEISFHYGWTLHRAGGNTTDTPRAVHTVIYIDKDIEVAKPKNDNQERDRVNWLSSAEVGTVPSGPRNPVLWQK